MPSAVKQRKEHRQGRGVGVPMHEKSGSGRKKTNLAEGVRGSTSRASVRPPPERKKRKVLKGLGVASRRAGLALLLLLQWGR